MRPDEVEKYSACYQSKNYRMSKRRLQRALKDIQSIPKGSTYLDVGCGRGESLEIAAERGIEARGVELVPYLCDGKRVVQAAATSLPFDHVDYVSCYDVLEHLPPDEVAVALDELFRVVRKALFITTNDHRATRKGVVLHLTRRPCEWWEKHFLNRSPNSKLTRSTFSTERDWHWRIEFP